MLSRYRNKVLKDKSQTNRENHKIQQNVCKKLLRKTRKSSFDSLNTKILRITEPSDKLLFLFLQKKASKGEKIILNEAEKHIPDDKKYAKLLIQSFKTLSQTKKYLTTVIIFPQRLHILSQLFLTLFRMEGGGKKAPLPVFSL